MARGPKYKVPYRRRREGKTNYYKRYIMVRSGKPRLVVRKTNKYIIAQLVAPSPIGDFTIVAAHSRELVKYFGWKGSTKNTPAAYLTGLLVGLRAVKLGLTEAVLDIGLVSPRKGAKVFAVAKGAIDAGMKIPCSEEVIPSDDRIRGETIARYASELYNSNRELFERLFSDYIRKDLNPIDLPQHFEEVRRRIISVYQRVPSMVLTPTVGGTE